MMIVFRGIICYDMKIFGLENRVNGYIIYRYIVLVVVGR